MNQRFETFSDYMKGRLSIYRWGKVSYKELNEKIKTYWEFLANFRTEIIKKAIHGLLEEENRKRFPTPGKIFQQCRILEALTIVPGEPVYCAFCSAIAPPKGQECLCGVIMEGLSDLTERPFDSTHPVLKDILKHRLERQRQGISQREYNIKRLKNTSGSYKGVFGRIGEILEKQVDTEEVSEIL